MYFAFTYRTIYHITKNPWEGDASRTLCGLECRHGRVVAERPGFLRLCKRCAKWLAPEENPGA